MPAASLEAAGPTTTSESESKPDTYIDGTVYGIVTNWGAVALDLRQHFQVDIYSPDILRSPWPPIRDQIISLLHTDSRLRAALTTRR